MADPAKEIPATFSAKEVCAQLGIDEKVFRGHVKKGDVRYIWIGRRKKFMLEDVLGFLKKQGKEPCPFTSRKVHRSTISTSKSRVIGFMEAREKRLRERLNR